MDTWQCGGLAVAVANNSAACGALVRGSGWEWQWLWLGVAVGVAGVKK
jgi:hypothetical protein